MKSNYQINNRTLSVLSSVEDELNIHPQKNYWFELSHLGALSLHGAKAFEFLQGQLTCDVRQATDIQMIPGAQCNLKGRILSLMDVVDWNGALLILPRDLIELTQQSLAKTALLSRVTLSANTNYHIFGLYYQNAEDTLPPVNFFPTQLYGKSQSADCCYYHLGAGFYIFIMPSSPAEEITNRFAKKQQLLGSLTWHTLRLKQKQFSIYPESRGIFLPHRLSLQQTAVLNFNKGCYKGQEIIARMHYRSTPKHELNFFTLRTEQQLYSGQKIMIASEDIEIGELIDYTYLTNNHDYLVALSIIKDSPTWIKFAGHDGETQLLAILCS